MEITNFDRLQMAVKGDRVEINKREVGVAIIDTCNNMY